MFKEYNYIKGQKEDKFIYKILGDNMTLYVKRLKDTKANRKKIQSRGTDLYLMGKCSEGFKYISGLRKRGSERDFEFDYQGKVFLMSLKEKAIIRAK